MTHRETHRGSTLATARSNPKKASAKKERPKLLEQVETNVEFGVLLDPTVITDSIVLLGSITD